MTELIRMNSEQTMSSREIAELTDKRHDHVLRDCSNLNDNYFKLGFPKIGEGYYTHPNTGNQKHREYLLTRMQTLDLMTGYNLELRIKVNRRWEELEKKQQNAIDFNDPATVLMLAQNWKEEQDKRLLAEATIKQQAPKVLFADAVATSNKSCLVGELAKILRQNGVNMGQNRLFEWLRSNGYLMRGKGERYNQPTQRAIEQGLFEIKKTTINKPDGSILVSTTTKVTGKGQIHFVEQFLKQRETA